MLICPRCNCQVDDDATFCNNCGVQFLPVENSAEFRDAQATTVLTPEMQQQYFANNQFPAQNNQTGNAGVNQVNQPFANNQENVPNKQPIQNDLNGYPQQGQYNPEMQNPQMSQNNFSGYSQNGQYNPGMQNNFNGQQFGNARPVAQLATNRSLLKMILLSMITLGIYGLIQYCKIVNDVNTVCTRYDGKKTMHYIVMLLLTPLTIGIISFVWNHNICERMGNELKRRNIPYDFGSKDFWLWGILGSLIVVGPFIYSHKLISASNKLNADFNIRG